jgi:hypothetical protein
MLVRFVEFARSPIAIAIIFGVVMVAFKQGLHVAFALGIVPVALFMTFVFCLGVAAHKYARHLAGLPAYSWKEGWRDFVEAFRPPLIVVGVALAFCGVFCLVLYLTIGPPTP